MKSTFFFLFCAFALLFCQCKSDKKQETVVVDSPSSISEEKKATEKTEEAENTASKTKDVDTKDISETADAANNGSITVPPSNRSVQPLPKKKTVLPPSEGTPEQNGFADVIALEGSIGMDIRYATDDNFTHSKIYDCPRCLLRPEAASALVLAHKTLKKKGLGLKMFDCYRPRPYQQRLWDKVPNPDYVTPPAKGSMHSRGAAVDLTIVDAKGKELDMGTPYDFFGRAAHTDHNDLPEKVLENRRLLRETLEAFGFKGIRTEWWHFSFQGKDYPLSDYVWPCK